MHYGRLFVATISLGVFYFIADGIIHGVFLGTEHKNAITGAGKPLVHNPASYAYFAFFDLGKAFAVVLLYAAVLPRAGAPVTAAIIAGLVGWFAVEALPAIAAMPFPFYEKSFYWKWIALELPPMVGGALLAAWIVKDRV